tara:strand:- start:490 stop:750 length:261 start_codon:yes stop_codon:yes gene_type:complete
MPLHADGTVTFTSIPKALPLATGLLSYRRIFFTPLTAHGFYCMRPLGGGVVLITDENGNQSRVSWDRFINSMNGGFPDAMRRIGCY